MSLPQSTVLKSSVSGKYLRYGKGKGSARSSLSFSHQIQTPTNFDAAELLESLKNKTKTEKASVDFHLLKFEVQEAKNAPGFVHIRTCYNNKYLVRESEESKKIVAEAHEAEEDQSKWSCTLFKPVFLGEAEDDEGCGLFGNKHGIGMTPQKIQLVHATSQEYVHVDTETESMKLTCDAPTTLTVSDVQPTAILPKYFALRGHDGKHLGTPNGKELWFQYDDLGDASVPMVTLNNFNYPHTDYLYPENYQGYWSLDENENRGISVSTKGSAISPVKVNNQVALYVTNNSKFILRTSDSGVAARSSSIIEDAKFLVVEPVLSRTIVSIEYDLENARVYDTYNVTKITDSRSNNTDHRETGSLEREYTMSRTMKWEQSTTVTVGISMEMSFGIPEVGLGEKISINFGVSETSAWGEEKSESETIKHVYDFDIPPYTIQTKKVVATRSKCDVPFTCVLEDLMTNGTTRSYTKTDCWFTGVNDYNAVEKTTEEPITPGNA